MKVLKFHDMLIKGREIGIRDGWIRTRGIFLLTCEIFFADMLKFSCYFVNQQYVEKRLWRAAFDYVFPCSLFVKCK